MEMFHENITMENHSTVKASFIIALEEPRRVPFELSLCLTFTSATPMYLTPCQLSTLFSSP